MRWIEDVEDLLPDPSRTPAGIAPVHRFPGTKLLGEFPPGAACSDDPEDAGEDQAVVGRRASDLGLLWWEQARNAVRFWRMDSEYLNAIAAVDEAARP